MSMMLTDPHEIVKYKDTSNKTCYEDHKIYMGFLPDYSYSR
jgi:hypothetical protein